MWISHKIRQQFRLNFDFHLFCVSGQEAVGLTGGTNRSATRSGTQYGLLWRQDSRDRRSANSRPPLPPVLPTAQRLQPQSNTHHESFISRQTTHTITQPDLIRSRHSIATATVTTRPEPDLLTVPHLYGMLLEFCRFCLNFLS